jgi:hypothetical protein
MPPHETKVQHWAPIVRALVLHKKFHFKFNNVRNLDPNLDML